MPTHMFCLHKVGSNVVCHFVMSLALLVVTRATSAADVCEAEGRVAALPSGTASSGGVDARETDALASASCLLQMKVLSTRVADSNQQEHETAQFSMNESQPAKPDRHEGGESELGQADSENLHLSTTMEKSQPTSTKGMGKSQSASPTRHSSSETEIGEAASEDIQSSTTTVISMNDSQPLSTKRQDGDVTETAEAGSAPAESPYSSNATVNQSEIPKAMRHKSGETQTSDWMKEYQPSNSFANDSNESSPAKSGTLQALASVWSLPLLGALALTLATVA